MEMAMDRTGSLGVLHWRRKKLPNGLTVPEIVGRVPFPTQAMMVWDGQGNVTLVPSAPIKCSRRLRD